MNLDIAHGEVGVPPRGPLHLALLDGGNKEAQQSFLDCRLDVQPMTQSHIKAPPPTPEFYHNTLLLNSWS